MIRCNLSILLAERNLKITKVSNDTGISRTTLTSLNSNRAQGIQFDTINTLCTYLKINPDQLISFIPVDIKLEKVKVFNDDLLEINLTIINNSRPYSCSLTGTCYKYYSGGKVSDLDIHVELWDEELNGKDIKEENRMIVNAFNKLSVSFRNDIQDKILDEIFYEVGDENLADPISYSFTWSNDLVSELN